MERNDYPRSQGAFHRVVARPYRVGHQPRCASDHADVMPTLLSLAGLPQPTERPLDGVNLSHLLLKGESPPARPLLWASLGNNGARNEAMRDGPWKLVVNHPNARPGSFENEKVELYRLDQDPAERNDLAAREPGQTKALLARLKAWYADTQRTATPQTGGW